MDAQYLKNNVNDALAEALTSMAVALPEDGVEYVGNYLLQYVERRTLQNKVVDNYKQITDKAAAEAEKIAVLAAAAEEKQAAVDSRQQELDNFISGLASTGSTKQEVMDSTTAFLAEYLHVPAVYIAVKRVAGENETLNYLSANPSQSHVVGKTLTKPPEDAEDLPPRQGCSFEAFKLPPVEEPEEPEDGEDAPPPPPPPVPQPLVIDNVMRDSRVKYFGIPKLGSFVAVPFEYKSCDHAAGLQKAEAAPPPEPAEGEEEGEAPPMVSEGEQSPWAKNLIPVQLIIGSDTISDFRRYSKGDIAIIQKVGEAALQRFEAIEDTMFKQQIEFVTNASNSSGPLAALIGAFGEEEAAAVAAATVQPEIPEDASDEVKEEMTLPPYTEAVAKANFYTQKVISSELSDATLSCSSCILPPPLPVLQLFYAVGLTCGVPGSTMIDVCGELSWDAIKANFISNSTSMMHVYDPVAVSTVKPENSIANIKTYCENNNVFDTAAYPPEMGSLVAVNSWLQRILAAREATIAFFKESKNEDLEIIEQ